MRKAAKQIAACALILLVCCVFCRFVFFDQFSIYIPLTDSPDRNGKQTEMQPQVEHPEVLQAGRIEFRSGYARIPILPDTPGETDINFGTEEPQAGFHVMKVDRFRTVYDLITGNFTGDTAVLIGVTLFWLLVSAIMVWHFFQAKGMMFYDYGTIYYAGFSLFALSNSLTMLSVTVSHILHPENYSMYSAYNAISGATANYMMLSTPVMLLFAGAVIVSNIALLRHERPRPQNALGLLVGALLVIGEAVGWYLFTRDFMGSEWEGRIDRTLKNTYATAFIYCQCMLTGAVICGIKAARHVPDADKDFIIILGCWFRKDGTLPPLLKGRADKALEFRRLQLEKSGKEISFIPSGGQGKDEPEAEAEAIRLYLLSQGVEDNRILPETESGNTRENMVFSGRIIKDKKPEGKAVFATSSYHVFRSGMWARQEGLSAEGIGSRTKWWFWPNAFIRETAGLLQKRWKQELLFLAALIVFFGVLSIIL